ncbi:cytochrome b5-like isoform X2 [Babylonia areolata]|uniref:cytochrome b5-like isoform X2 n=1 Tax=Babylonia areolata TaxID=304850 RepID=UPI003FD1307A
MADQRKVFRAAEVRKHASGDSAWFVIHNKVFDVTKLLTNHPGGDEVLLQQAGGDATEHFQAARHSRDARELKESFYIGDLHPLSDGKPTETSVSSRPTMWWIPVILALLGALVYPFLGSPSD